MVQFSTEVISKTMTCIFRVLVLLVALLTSGAADLVENAEIEISDKVTKSDISPATPNLEEAISMPEGMAHALEEFRTTAELAIKLARDGVLPKEETEKQYIKMAEILEEILDYMYSANNAYGFLQAKGLDTVIAPNINIDFPQLRIPLLQLLKALFDIAPTTTVTVIPNSILDRLVDIYEQDEDLDIKTHAIELLSVWLPGNPHAQTRVMKMRGLQPFYKQLAKLDLPVMKPTLELFNKILNEHVAVRNKKLQKNKADYKTFQLYQQIGLIERLSTPMMCNGLLSIFDEIFSYSTPDKDMLPPLLKLLQFIKPHCSKVFSGRSNVATMIDKVLEQVEKPIVRLELEKMKVNVTQVIADLHDFAELVKPKPHVEL